MADSGLETTMKASSSSSSSSSEGATQGVESGEVSEGWMREGGGRDGRVGAGTHSCTYIGMEKGSKSYLLHCTRWRGVAWRGV